jgi:hypothetical protein
MALISRWDIRTESYTNGATVTSLTDRAGSTNLDSAIGTVKPTFDSALNAVKFVAASTQCLGSSSLAAGLSAAPASSAWSIFYLIYYQSGTTNGFAGGFGNSTQVNSGLLARIFSDASNPDFFLRDNTDAAEQLVTTSIGFTNNAWSVFHATYNGTNVQAGVNGSGLGTSALTENLAGVTWNQFALGAYARSTTGNFWTGFLRECRIYNSNESANLSTIIASMQAGPSSLITSAWLTTL